MKRNTKIFFKTLVSSLLCLAVFVSVGYFYLESANKPAETKQESVPYYQIPESRGVMLEIGESRILFYFDFEGEALSVVFAEEFSEDETVIYGYSADYTIETDYSVLEGIIDTLGGVDLTVGEEALNYTGAQVSEILNTTVDKTFLKRDITEKILSSIAQKGISIDDFVFIIENSETALTVPDCYFWAEYMAVLCKNVRFVN